jgi:hypothetical protein
VEDDDDHGENYLWARTKYKRDRNVTCNGVIWSDLLRSYIKDAYSSQTLLVLLTAMFASERYFRMELDKLHMTKCSFERGRNCAYVCFCKVL